MKKKLLGLFLAGALAMSLPFVGFALEAPPEWTPEDEGVFDLQTFLENLAGWVFWIVMIIAFIFIVLAALTFITAGGDPEKVAKARNQLIYGLIGVAVAVLANALISWVATFVGAA